MEIEIDPTGDWKCVETRRGDLMEEWTYNGSLSECTAFTTLFMIVVLVTGIHAQIWSGRHLASHERPDCPAGQSHKAAEQYNKSGLHAARLGGCGTGVGVGQMNHTDNEEDQREEDGGMEEEYIDPFNPRVDDGLAVIASESMRFMLEREHIQ